MQLLEAFRDFFHYGSKESLREAYITIAAVVWHCQQFTKRSTGIMEEFTFNRLFVGPMAPQAPAVASVYLDPEGLIQGAVTAEVRDILSVHWTES